jgi:hypothetical protein
MTTIKATIEFNKQDLIKDGIQYIPTGEFRQVKEGEHYLDPYSDESYTSFVNQWNGSSRRSIGKYIVLNPVSEKE